MIVLFVNRRVYYLYYKHDIVNVWNTGYDVEQAKTQSKMTYKEIDRRYDPFT